MKQSIPATYMKGVNQYYILQKIPQTFPYHGSRLTNDKIDTYKISEEPDNILDYIEDPHYHSNICKSICIMAQQVGDHS